MTATYVDISSHNGMPNLAVYRAAGHTDLMLKATEGTGYAWAGMQALAREWHSFGPQYRCGYYHWLYGTLSGSQQYAWFWSQVGPVFRAGDWLMVDFEDVDPSRWVPDATHLAVLQRFAGLAVQRGQLHYYAPDWYLGNLPQCRAWLKGRPVVASDYSHDPPLNHYGLTFVAHQYTDRATVPGFTGPVDCNRWLSAESTDSGGVTKIGDDMPLSSDDVEAVAVRVMQYLDGTINRVVQIAAEVAANGGLRKNIRDTACAIGGQLPALPDGTKISSIGAALLASNAHIDAALASLAGGGPQVDVQVILDQLQKLPADVVAQIAAKLGAAA